MPSEFFTLKPRPKLARELILSDKVATHSIGGLFDDAKMAMNSSIGTKGQRISNIRKKHDIEYLQQTIGKNPMYRCRYSHLDFDGSLHQACQVADVIARMCDGCLAMLDGQKDGPADATRFWFSPTRDLAERHLLLCIILCTGSPSYFIEMEKRHHRMHDNFSATKKCPPKKITESIGSYYITKYQPSGRPSHPAYFYLIMDRTVAKKTKDRASMCIGLLHHKFGDVLRDNDYKLNKAAKSTITDAMVFINPLAHTVA